MREYSSQKTLYDKLWDGHVVDDSRDGFSLLYVDAHLIHEVTSPQAFWGLKEAKRRLWRGDSILAVPDHAVPTTGKSLAGVDASSRLQIDKLQENCHTNDLLYIPFASKRQGIVHIIGAEQGFTLPGMTIVCGDSHTTTHGALGTLAMGIGTSEVEHVMATQCLLTKKLKNMRVVVDGVPQNGVTAKDIILHVIGKLGTAGGIGHAIEYMGSTIEGMTLEERMTVCNMTIEAGARCGLVACDDTTLKYVYSRPFAPQGSNWGRATSSWQQLHSDPGAHFDKEASFQAHAVPPQVTWGTSPEMVIAITESVPNPEHEKDPIKRQGKIQAMKYMGLEPGTNITDIKMDKVFIGSCTNSRIEDLRAAARVVRNRHIADNIKLALVVPGSGLVRAQAEQENIDEIFSYAGFEWRQPGCSMCLAMNADRLEPQERCASTSNRNFEGRQGAGGRTHLASPASVAAAAIKGHFTDIRDWQYL